MNIKERIWPMLEKDNHSSEESPPENANPLVIEDDNLDAAFQLQTGMADAEEDRRKSVESKAALLLSTISLASSIVVAANTLVTANKEFSIAERISVFISFVLTVYTLRTVWFAIRALERGSYHVLSFEDINLEGNKAEYLRSIIQIIHKQTVLNQETINRKVDWLALSQEYYKRGLAIISIYAFLILCYSFFSPKPKVVEMPGEVQQNLVLPHTDSLKAKLKEKKISFQRFGTPAEEECLCRCA